MHEWNMFVPAQSSRGLEDFSNKVIKLIFISLSPKIDILNLIFHPSNYIDKRKSKMDFIRIFSYMVGINVPV